MSIEALKQQARRHEQNEEWHKALDQYNKALAELARDEQVDIGLYNRVGDLCVRVGTLDLAVEHYEQAVDLYREAYLPNNAIAVCKKIIRNVPERHQAYLRIGQIRAEQGFLPDARTHFLTYAERMQQAGDLDESFRALIEFCDLAPDDVGVRVTVAEQMAANGRAEEAVEQLTLAHRHLTQIGETDQARDVEDKILSIDPEADLTAMPVMTGEFGSSSVGDDGEILADFGEIRSGADGFGDEEEPEIDFAAAVEEPSEDSGDFVVASADDVDEEEAVELPIIGFEGEAEDDEVVKLPMMGFADEPDEEEAVELPTMGFADDADEEEAVELPTIDFADEGEEAAAVEFTKVPSRVEEADSGLDVSADTAAETVEQAMEDVAADAFEVPIAEVQVPIEMEAPVAEVPEPPPTEAPRVEDVPPEPAEKPAPDEGYIDFGAMILGGGEEKSTRFTVAYEEPSGDEEADFAKMLSQFKDKVSENLDSSDVRAHYDLGTAYKEMGLLDEAISAFQAALRASSDHLPTYELMGQTFLDMGQPEAAVKSLQRALEVGATVEDELVGIYYYLARAFEALEDKGSAVEYYDRVFSLDINFADVTERLRELR